ncbi:MAG: YfhO family protein [Chlorobi bacterium]|nr:YfhO family protein [Chlorobiota bacterium]
MSKSKQIKSRAEKKSNAPDSFGIDKFIPVKYQTAFLLALIVLIFLVYFSPMYFGNKTFESSDIITSKALTSYVDNHKDGYTLWYPYIFLGMPAYALAVDFKWFNLIYVGLRAVRDTFSVVFNAEYSMWTFYLLLLAFTSFLLVNYLTKEKLLALFAALATSFSTGIILFLFIGHVTKLTAIWVIPFVFLMLLRFQKKITLRDFALLTIALQLSVQGWHVQIIFYSLFAVGIYYVYYLIHFIAAKDDFGKKQIFKSAGTFALAFLIALLIQADNLTQIYQWNPYSTRGTESIADTEKGNNPKKSESDFYQYATNWSFSPEEVATFVVPSFYGFGKIKYSSELTRGQEIELNTYFGQMPFVDVAMYMGGAVFFLALLSMYINRKNPFVQFLTILSAIALLISFGRNFPLVYDLMFNYFPFFNKFRVPSMILVLVQISFPILAALGVKSLLDMKKRGDLKIENVLKYSAIVFSAIFVLSVVASGMFADSFMSRFASSEKGSNLIKMYQKYGLDIAGVAKDVFISDVMTVFAILSIVAWAFYGYFKSWFGKDAALLILIVVTLFDLIRIDNRGAKYNDVVNLEGMFNEPEYVKVIKAQKDKQPFRILNLKQDGSLGSFNHNSNFNAYFLLQDFYGYSSIKPRAYQDMMDVIGPANPTLWDLTNVKYLITDKPMQYAGFTTLKEMKGTYVSVNHSALPRAFFVNKVEKKKPIDILNGIKNNEFDPSQVAFAEIGETKIDAPDSSASVKFLSYADEKIEIETVASGNNFMVLSDTYYPNGWKAFIDGAETEIYRTDHALRGIVVPQGKHKILFTYDPVSFEISKYLALSLSGGLYILLIFGIWNERRKNSEEKTG